MVMREERTNVLLDKSFSFALKCINIYRILVTKQEFILSKQLLRSGSSIGANIREAQHAESRADFIHALAIAQKECDESLCWLELLFVSAYISNHNYASLTKDASEILKMLKSSILTT